MFGKSQLQIFQFFAFFWSTSQRDIIGKKLFELGNFWICPLFDQWTEIPPGKTINICAMVSEKQVSQNLLSNLSYLYLSHKFSHFEMGPSKYGDGTTWRLTKQELDITNKKIPYFTCNSNFAFHWSLVSVCWWARNLNCDKNTKVKLYKSLKSEVTHKF